MQKPLIIAHRGDTANFPENTVEAFQSAVERGADGIEFDVHLNDQGVPIVVHNYLFDRSQTYPTLLEIVEMFGKRTLLEIEIKSLEDEAVSKVAEIIDRFRPLEIEITSSVPVLFDSIFEHFPNDRRGLIFRSNLIEEWMPQDFVEYLILRHMALTNATVLHFELDQYFPRLIQSLHEKGYRAHSFTRGKFQDISNRC